MAARVRDIEARGKRELDEHRTFKGFLRKLGKDNIGMLAGFLSWSILTSIIPIVVGLVALSSLFLRNPSTQHTVVVHLSQALKGVFTTTEVQNLVNASVKHAGILAIIGIVGALWGASNVGGALSTTFQAVYETKGRNFIVEKLLDIIMTVVFTVLMLVIIVATAAGSILNKLVSGVPLPSIAQFVIGTGISLAAAFLLFSSIYLAFPNIHPRFKWKEIVPGALLAAVLFEIITWVWPIYAHFAHFSRYGAAFVPILVLGAWIYFFSLITLFGAELSAVFAIREAQAEGKSVGPPPEGSVPQHEVLRETRPRVESGDGHEPGRDREAIEAGRGEESGSS